jgi:hypothetical protein
VWVVCVIGIGRAHRRKEADAPAEPEKRRPTPRAPLGRPAVAGAQ